MTLKVPIKNRFTVDEAIAFAQSRHQYWTDYLNDWLRMSKLPAMPAQPICQIVVETNRAAGYQQKFLMGDNICSYNLPYVILNGDCYDETVAHEVCHAFQRHVAGRKTQKHGETFFFLFNQVCGIPRGKFHTYDMKSAKALAALLKLQERAACKGGK